MNNVNNNLINIMAQGFYGNRTMTAIKKEDIDNFIVGHHTDEFPAIEPIDRTIIELPNTDGLVIIYNKYNEERAKELKDEALKEDNYIMKPTAVIPEKDIELYSRCVACRMNANGEFEGFQKDDYNNITKYFTE